MSLHKRPCGICSLTHYDPDCPVHGEAAPPAPQSEPALHLHGIPVVVDETLWPDEWRDAAAEAHEKCAGHVWANKESFKAGWDAREPEIAYWKAASKKDVQLYEMERAHRMRLEQELASSNFR